MTICWHHPLKCWDASLSNFILLSWVHIQISNWEWSDCFALANCREYMKQTLVSNLIWSQINMNQIRSLEGITESHTSFITNIVLPKLKETDRMPFTKNLYQYWNTPKAKSSIVKNEFSTCDMFSISLHKPLQLIGMDLNVHILTFGLIELFE
jgi:hypothetical protein